MMNYLRLFYCATLCFPALTAAQAQDPQPAKLYERGVNAYFGGQGYQADALLSEAIQWNSSDPRAYYFRALSLLRVGRVAEARGDMLVGATLETQSPQRQAIGAALERVQGCDRLLLEQFRCHARHDAVTQASATTALPGPTIGAPSQTLSPTNASQPQTFKESDAAVLRERRIVPLEELLRPGGPQTVVEEPLQQSQTNAPAAGPAEKAAAPSAPPANPFEDDSQKSTPAAAKPAAEPPKIPPQTTPAPTPPASSPAKSDENPFG
jgi:hypothetical protein